MSDAKLEAKLAKYRAPGPPDDLRDRVLNTPARDTRVGWMSIAALLFIIVVLQVLAAGERASVLRAVHPPDLSRNAVVRDLARGLGGDARARRFMEVLLHRDELTERGSMLRWSGIDREVHP